MTFPQQEAGFLHVALAEASQREARVPEPHLVEGVTHLHAGVAAEVLIGEEQHLVGGLLIERPREHGARIRRGADGAAVAAHERLEGGRRIHVGDRDHAVDVGDAADLLPRLLDRLDVGHVGHRAAGVQVGQEHLLMVGGQDVGRLGHEVDAAEDDVGGLVLVGRDPRQPERVASGIGPAHDFVALVVVAQNEEPRSERGLRGRDAIREFVRRGVGVALGERTLESEHV